MAAPAGLQRLAEPQWLARRAAHEARVRAWTQPHAERAAARKKHPVYDFLFEYYHFRPSWLARWHPGLGTILEGPRAQKYLGQPGYRAVENGATADPQWLKPQRREAVRWILNLLCASREGAPFFGCGGLHEWAMVYRAPQVRHDAWPLRFDDTTLASIVESQSIRCSHFDAFRFFTEPARPLNRLQPTKETMPALEQRGCLHTNMDLYKWAFKLAPYTPSELVGDAFALARDIREIDMRASPYDLRALGFEAIPIETPEGRAQYEQEQRRFSQRGVPIRARLIDVCERLVAEF